MTFAAKKHYNGLILDHCVHSDCLFFIIALLQCMVIAMNSINKQVESTELFQCDQQHTRRLSPALIKARVQ